MSLARPCAEHAAVPQLFSLPTNGDAYHRLAEVRRQQGISHRTVARRLDTSVSQVKMEERETTDLPLSRLYQWQEALEVPIEELLVEANDGLSSGIQEREQLVRVMKTVLAILERTNQKSIKRMGETLVGQLLELMPELKDIGPWHTVGRRRRRDELGVAAHRRLAEELFVDRGE